MLYEYQVYPNTTALRAYEHEQNTRDSLHVGEEAQVDVPPARHHIS